MNQKRLDDMLEGARCALFAMLDAEPDITGEQAGAAAQAAVDALRRSLFRDEVHLVGPHFCVMCQTNNCTCPR